MSCFICNRIQQISENTNPYFIAELKHSYAVLCDFQFYRGYCILLYKKHVGHLDQISEKVLLELFSDVMLVARSIMEAFAPERINYECLGNQINHVHWHVIPRYADDPDPQKPIWVIPKDTRSLVLVESEMKKLKKALQKQIGKVR